MNAIFAFVLLAAPLVVEAQQGETLRRIGVLTTFSSEHPQRDLFDAFRRGLRELGYVEGQNIVIEYRSAQGKAERLPDLFAELTRLKVDLILVLGGTPMARAAKHANVTIPVIAPAMGDPVDDGVVASLAHPGGNITGSTFLGPALVPKRIELLKEAIPGVSRVAALWHPGAYGDRTMTEMLKETEAAGQKLGVQLQLLEAWSANDFDRAFSAMTRERARALVVLPSPMFYGEHKRIVELALKSRLPAIFAFREAADGGGLMSYGANLSDLFRRGAIQSDHCHPSSWPDRRSGPRDHPCRPIHRLPEQGGPHAPDIGGETGALVPQPSENIGAMTPATPACAILCAKGGS
jgi:putative tryptophan/tyrosine transport system substrate-binding protein